MFGKSDMEGSFAEFLERIAAEAGLRVRKLNPNLVTVPFRFPDGREQRVWVGLVGLDPMKNRIVRFSSPVLEMSRDQQLGQKAANDLLRENARLPHGAWGIDTVQDKQYLVILDTQIGQSMDAREFKASTETVAVLADKKEQEVTGEDVF